MDGKRTIQSYQRVLECISTHARWQKDGKRTVWKRTHKQDITRIRVTQTAEGEQRARYACTSVSRKQGQGKNNNGQDKHKETEAQVWTTVLRKAGVVQGVFSRECDEPSIGFDPCFRFWHHRQEYLCWVHRRLPKRLSSIVVWTVSKCSGSTVSIVWGISAVVPLWWDLYSVSTVLVHLSWKILCRIALAVPLSRNIWCASEVRIQIVATSLWHLFCTVSDVVSLFLCVSWDASLVVSLLWHLSGVASEVVYLLWKLSCGFSLEILQCDSSVVISLMWRLFCGIPSVMPVSWHLSRGISPVVSLLQCLWCVVCIVVLWYGTSFVGSDVHLLRNTW